MFCRECGKEMQEDTAACPSCGKPVTAAAPQETKKKKGLGGCALAAIIVAILLVVIVIAGGIVAAVAFPTFIKYKGKAMESATKANRQVLVSTMALYYSDTGGKWPGKIEELVPSYMEEIPAEKITGSRAVKVARGSVEVDFNSDSEPQFITGEGGWVYVPNLGQIFVNLKGKDSNGVPYWKYGKD